MVKRMRFWILIMILYLALSSEVQAQEIIQDIDWSGLDEAVEESFLSYDTFYEYLTAVLKGETDFDISYMCSYISDNLISEMRSSVHYIVQMTGLCITAWIMRMLNSGAIALYAVMIGMTWIAVQSFKIPCEILYTVIHRIQMLGQAEMPVLAAITLASGRFTSSVLQGEILLSVLNLLLHIMNYIFMPLIQILFLLYIIEAITGDEWSTGIANILRILISKGMKVMTVVLLILVSLKIQITGISDVWLKKAAVTVVSSIPVVGKSLSGALDTVTSSAMILLKTVGILGIMLMLAICILPICKILLLWLLYTVFSSLSKPFVAGNIHRVINGISECVSLLVGLMICILISYIGVVLVFVISVKGG